MSVETRGWLVAARESMRRVRRIVMEFKGVDTKAVHAGEPRPRVLGAVTLPIFQSTVFESFGDRSYHDISYIRLSNLPNHQALGHKLAALESAEAAVVTGSGMAAISTALLTVLRAGDHLLVQDCLYGGTHTFLTAEMERFGVAFDFIDADRPETWKDKLRPNTKAIYVETMTNPLLQVGDLRAIVAFAREHSLVSLIDNTFASPINFRPIEIGFDLCLHSCTKYLNGHSDIVAGAVIGDAARIEQVLHKLGHLGGVLDPHACFLLQRGMKTLALRVRFQNHSALKLARFLEAHSAVAKVNYPGLTSHPRHERAKELFEGFGGVLSFELKGGVGAAEKLVMGLQIPAPAPSLGGVESLITRPVTTSHAGMAKEERDRLGITDGLVRLSVGIESIDDLIDDFSEALRSL